MNWISATGRKPWAATPIDAPTMTVSASGVSRTRSAPKRACRPSVTRNTPPFTPTSSPRTSTRSSSSMARPRARLSAWTSVISAISGVPERLVPLVSQIRGQRLVHVVERRLRARRGGWRGTARPPRRPRRRTTPASTSSSLLAPPVLGVEMRPESGDGVFLPVPADDLVVTISTGVVGGRVVGQTIGQRLDR